jgi:hypothetical protein
MKLNDMLPWLIPLLLSGGIPIACALIGKLMPVAKLSAIMVSFFTGLAVALEAILLRWFPKKAEGDIEEAVFCTLATGLIDGLTAFRAKLRENNDKKE